MDYRKYLPSREQLRRSKSIRLLGDVIFEPNLWHFNRHSISYAILIGSICCWLPMPFQTLVGLPLAVWIRCNIPLTVAIIWVSNPITMGPMMFFAYLLGSRILGVELAAIPENADLSWFLDQLGVIWQPLLLGCLICGIGIGSLGFLTVRGYFRWRAARYKLRKRASREQNHS